MELKADSLKRKNKIDTLLARFITEKERLTKSIKLKMKKEKLQLTPQKYQGS